MIILHMFYRTCVTEMQNATAFTQSYTNIQECLFLIDVIPSGILFSMYTYIIYIFR